MYRFRMVILLTLMVIFCSAAAACGEYSDAPASDSVQFQTSTTAETTSAATTAASAATAASTSVTAATQPVTEPATADMVRAGLEAVCTDRYGSVVPFRGDQDMVDGYIQMAESFSGFAYGPINSEEDAIAAVRQAFLECGCADAVERAEAEYIEYQGEMHQFTRINPPYRAQYYEEYDLWTAGTTGRFGVLDNGVQINSAGTYPYLIMRGSDGTVIGAFS